MGQSRKQQLDKIFTKYPHKSPTQISKDHGIPYSTVYSYHRKFTKPLAVIEAEYKPRMPKPVTYTKGDMIMAVIGGTLVGVVLVFLLGAI